MGSSVLSRLWYFLSPLDGASVREAHCEQASTAVHEAHCAQATVARLVTFESLKCKYSFATNSTLFMKLGLLLYVRCRHRSAKSTAVSNKTFLFQVTNIYFAVQVLRCPHKRIVTITKVYIARNNIHVELIRFRKE